MKTFLVPKPPGKRKTKFLLDLSGDNTLLTIGCFCFSSSSVLFVCLFAKLPGQRKAKFPLDLSADNICFFSLIECFRSCINIHLAGNPFVCDCWVSEIWQAVRG